MKALVKLNNEVIASFLVEGENEKKKLYNTLYHLDISYDMVEFVEKDK